MGDLPKAPDDATWTEVERSFFAAAPPEPAQSVGEATRVDDLPAPLPARPRREIVARLKATAAGTRRVTALVLRAAGGLVRSGCRWTVLIVGGTAVNAWETIRDGAAGLLGAPAPASWRVDRRRLAFVLVGAILVAGLTAGRVTSRKGALTKGETASERPPVGATVAEEAPVATPMPPAAPPADVRSSADPQAPRADVPKRRTHARRAALPASSPTQRPMVTAFMDRETYWSQEARSTPVRSSSRSF